MADRSITSLIERLRALEDEVYPDAIKPPDITDFDDTTSIAKLKSSEALKDDDWEVDYAQNDNSVIFRHTPTGDEFRFGSDGVQTVDGLEATDSITDPQGNTFTSLSDPVRVTEEASTFTESGVTVTHRNTETSNGSIQLTGSQTSGDAVVEFDSGVPTDINTWDLATFQRTLDNETVVIDVGEISIVDGSTTPLDTDSSSFSDSDKTGIEFNPNISLKGIGATISSQTSGFAKAYIEDDSSNVLDSKDISSLSAGDSFEFNYSFTPGTTYQLLLDNNGGSYTVGFLSASYPFTSSDVDVTAGVAGTPNTSERYSFQSITAKVKGVSNELSNISKNTDISTFASDQNIGFTVNLSRNDTSNNPTVDYLARRFTR